MAAIVLSANAEFKGNYSKYIRYSIVGALIIHFIIFFFSPPFEFKPYRLKEERFEVVDLPQNIEIPPPPQEVALPKVPVEAVEGEEDADKEIGPTTFDTFEELPPPPAPSSGKAEMFLAFDEPPMLQYYESPKYPQLAREAGIEGTVSVKVLVGEDGKVLDAVVLSSDVTPDMERAAIEAAKKCRFKPAKQRTVPVKAHVMIPFQFKLTGAY
ncbi:MAG: TonB family protein [Candidatus Latescibacteria bacterium]|nr:TonB family protein [Candidatus Latescibacterota bacterium]NIO27301.1 TonB family protein [Candidatus Latescibacterota bacterium]NIO54825.1 TonB family protein [Candidatus Latescibacterota bacterium]NIT00908.1 TonB family protein [Candidatus Latescibacterota bacterium]NIT37831.1 TonB family protein [Candidatus Latescibacterota bacterium]